jgi:uroporphyrinogen-III synthase
MPGRRKKIWITRARPAAEATAERVRAMGHEAVVSPVLAVRNLDQVEIDLAGVAALAFTSANGVRAFAEKSGERGLKVFAVGSATAQAARQAGFRSVLSADGDVEALAYGIVARRSELKGLVLHAGAAEPAGDLVGELAARGMEARLLKLYETTPVAFSETQAKSLLKSDVVLLHSPRAAKVVARLLRAEPTPGLRALGLSRAVLKPLARVRLAAKLAPPYPLEAALLQLIEKDG